MGLRSASIGHRRGLQTLVVLSFLATAQTILARNPAVTQRFSADPSAHIWPNSDRLWVYASHDQDNAEDMATMSEYYVYSTLDMVRCTRLTVDDQIRYNHSYTGNPTTAHFIWTTPRGH